MKSRVRLPGDIIFRLRLHQNLDPANRRLRVSLKHFMRHFTLFQIWSGRSVLRGVPRLLTTPGQTWWIPYCTNFIRKDSGCWCNLNLKVISPGSRTRDFTFFGRYNYNYAVKVYIKLDVSLHGVAVVIPTNDHEIPGSTPGRYNLQIKITSLLSSTIRKHFCVYLYFICHRFRKR